MSPRVEIHEPFRESSEASVTVAIPCEVCDEENAPHSGYFARVQLFAENSETSLPQGDEFFDGTTALPVVVNVEGAGRP